jgi:DHA1 family multidrug resistance protein-like MFS transporter
MDSPNDHERDALTRPADPNALPGGREVTPAGTAAHGGAPQRTSWFQLAVVCAASFVAWTAFGAILPYLPLFLKDQAHSSLLMIGVIAAMYYVGTLLFSSPLGWLSDSIGRKPVMVGGVALTALAMLLFTTTTDPYWFILFRLLEGIGTAGVGPAGQAFIADITPERDRSKAYGILTTAQFGGLIVGPALAPPLYHLAGGGLSGFYAIFYFGAILAAITTVVMLVFVKEPAATRARRAAREARGQTKPERPPYRTVLTRPILAFVLVAFMSHFAMGGWEVVWSIWLDHLGASKAYIGLTWVAFSVPMLLSFAGGMLADRYSRFMLMFTGYTISAVAWILYGSTTNLTIFLLVNVIEGVAIAFSYPAKQAFLIQVSPPKWLGTVTGIETTSMQLAGLLGTLTAPLLYGLISGYVLAVGGVMALAGLAAGAPVLHREWRRISASGDRRSYEELETLADRARPDAAALPPSGIE